MNPNKYGLIIEEKEGDYIFGASSIPYENLVPDGNWEPYLPVKEFQNLKGFEN